MPLRRCFAVLVVVGVAAVRFGLSVVVVVVSVAAAVCVLRQQWL